MKKVDAQETFADPAFPVLGVDLSRPYDVQRDGTTFLGSNVRAFEPATQRGRGGSRPGISRFILDRLPSGDNLVQNLSLVVTADGTALLVNYDDTPPDLYDPSSFGPFETWPPGRFTRTPYLPIPTGGWGIQPNKNAPEQVQLNWARPSDIASGTALSGTQLNASAVDHATAVPVAGSYVYYPVSGTQLPVGADQALAVIFTPSDIERYRSTPKANLITVIDAGPTDIEFVQAKSSFDGSSGSVKTLAFTSSVTSGNFILVALWDQIDPFAAISGITDSQGNVYTQVGGYRTSNDEGDGTSTVSLWRTFATASNVVTVSITLAQSVGFTTPIAIAEYKNVNTASPVGDVQSASIASGATSLATPSVSITEAGELLFAVFTGGGAVALSAGSGFTLRGASSFILVEDKIGPSSSQTATASASPGLALSEPVIAAAFKKA